MDHALDRSLRILMILIAVTLLGVLLRREFGSLFSAPGESASPAPTFYEGWEAIAASGRWIGSPDATVVVVEFGDFECPFCRRFAEEVAAVQAIMGDTVALSYLHLPLTNIHRFAMPAAIAAECAHLQGRFKALHDVLFEKQDSLGLKSWSSYAMEAGIPDSMSFASCVRDETPRGQVEAQAQLARELDLTGTPSLLINGWLWRGFLSRTQLEAAIRSVLDGRSPIIE